MGADDYVAKPFRPEEFRLRMRAVLNRTGSQRGAPAKAEPEGDEMIRCGALTVLPGAREVRCHGVPVGLTAAEYDALHLLIQVPGAVVSRQALCAVALGRELAPMERSLDNLISRLRKKLEEAGEGPDQIQSARGRGYYYCV